MRIGVMTFWWSEDNYGQLLQCYALQKYLRDLGHDAFLIRYRMKEVAQFGLKKKLIKYGLHPWRIFDGFRRIASRRRGKEDLAAHDRKFGEFRDTYLKMSDRVYHSIEELRAAPPMADMYIVGSDQVWRFGETFTEGDVHAMMLDFGPENVRRISYAASFGRTQLGRNERPELASLLNRFEAISLREASGIGICAEHGRSDAVQVCDPTLLVSAGDFSDVAERQKPTGRYVFCYMLTNDCRFKYPELKRWADARELGIVYVTGNSSGNCDYADGTAARSYLSIPQWLGALAGAEFVVTNSFHCCVFAAHFNRKVGVIPLNGAAAGMNTRLDALDRTLESPLVRIGDGGFDSMEDAVSARFVAGASASGREFLNAVLSPGGAA